MGVGAESEKRLYTNSLPVDEPHARHNACTSPAISSNISFGKKELLDDFVLRD
jgi:hypothetical protein